MLKQHFRVLSKWFPAAPITKGRHRFANQFDHRCPRAPPARTPSWCPSPSASASPPRRPSARGTAGPAPPPPVCQTPPLLNPSTAAPAGNTAPPIVTESLTRVTHVCPTSTTVAARDCPGNAAAICRQNAACVGGNWGSHVLLWVGLWGIWSVCGNGSFAHRAVSPAAVSRPQEGRAMKRDHPPGGLLLASFSIGKGTPRADRRRRVLRSDGCRARQ